MITIPTVFILGAGVSMPYGFPSGKGLLRQIYEATKSKTTEDANGGRPNLNDIGVLLREEFGKTAVMEFGDELYGSQQTSIDAFLEHRQEFMKIGKTAIALCLARKENDDKLFDMDVRDRGCYQYLFQKMNSNWETFAQNKVAFVTFNYDRSLEEYLFTALKFSYGKNDDECAGAIRCIPIVHVHGSLGPLPWQSSMGIPYSKKYIASPKGEVFSGLYRERMRDNIIVISEGQDESPEFAKAFDLLNHAGRIYFLGFGYHPTNLRRLRTRELVVDTLLGSAMGMERAEMFSAITHSINGFDEKILPDNTSDSLLFLRKYVDFS